MSCCEGVCKITAARPGKSGGCVINKIGPISKHDTALPKALITEKSQLSSARNRVSCFGIGHPDV